MSTDTTTIKGVWWKPEDPNKKLQGEILYGPMSGAEIDLFGLFYNPLDEASIVQRFTLYGLTFKQTPITLFGCFAGSSSLHLGGGGASKINSVSGIVGGHYESLDKVYFKKVCANITGLRDWILTSGFEIKFAEKPGGFTLAYQVPNSISLGEFDSISIRIEFKSVMQPGVNHVQIEQDCILVLEAKHMLPYANFAQYFNAFQRFLCLAIQRPIYSTKIIGNIDQPKFIANETPVFEDYMMIRKATGVDDWEKEKLTPHDQLFILSELKPSPELVFKQFMERQECLEAPMDLYFSTVYNQTHLPRVEFLTLAQSLEAYHRVAMPGVYMNEESYRGGLHEKLSQVIATSPELEADFRASLNKKLQYLNEFSLLKRLRDLARKHATILQPFLGKAEDFSQSVSDLRNKLTHPTKTSVGADKDYHRLLRLSEQMALLLEVCFLNEIGFAEDQIKAIVSDRSKRAVRIDHGWI